MGDYGSNVLVAKSDVGSTKPQTPAFNASARDAPKRPEQANMGIQSHGRNKGERSVAA